MIPETSNSTTTRLGAIIETARRIPIQGQGSHASVSYGFNLAAIGSRMLVRDNPPSQQARDGYQIALIPFRIAAGKAVINFPSNGDLCHLLLLPLTWEDLVSQNVSQSQYARAEGSDDIVQFGEVWINFLTLEASRSNRPVSLTAMEFKTLRFFVANPYRAICRDELLNEVWGYDNYPCTRTVDNRILKLRQRLEKDSANPVHFRTVHGVGYKFTP